MPSGRTRDNALIGIIQRWAQQQPEEVRAWAAAFPDGELKQSAEDWIAPFAIP